MFFLTLKNLAFILQLDLIDSSVMCGAAAPLISLIVGAFPGAQVSGRNAYGRRK
jgi:hypothetical protein